MHAANGLNGLEVWLSPLLLDPQVGGIEQLAYSWDASRMTESPYKGQIGDQCRHAPGGMCRPALTTEHTETADDSSADVRTPCSL